MMSGRSSQLENQEIARAKRKRPRAQAGGEEDAGETPESKRVPSSEESEVESEASGQGNLVIADPEVAENTPEENPERVESPPPGSIDDLPMEALLASTQNQFSSCLRPVLIGKYPSATSTEINSIISTKWKSLKEARRQQAGNLGSSGGTKRSNSHETADDKSRTKRRAAKNISRTAYLDEDVDSPASEVELAGDHASLRKGRRLLLGRKRTELKVPRMKIKMIGRSRESDSPIFFAQSVEDGEEEGSGSERSFRGRRKGKRKGEDSETSSLQLEEEVVAVPQSASDGEYIQEEEEEEEEEDVEGSEGEHADYCFICKDGGQLLCCDHCPLAYHLSCLVPPLKQIPKGDWSCPRCWAEPLPAKAERLLLWRWVDVEENGDDEAEGEDSAIDDGPQNNSNTPEKSRVREFMCKWAGLSYWQCSWVSEIRLEVYQPNTLRSYVRKHNMMVAPPMELPAHLERRRRRRSSFYDEKTEEKEMMLLRAGVKPQWLLIHRVINHHSKRGHEEYLVKWRDLPYDQATWEKLGGDCPYRGAADAIRQYNKLRGADTHGSRRKKGRPAKQQQPRIDVKQKYTEQPGFVSDSGGTLHPYQLEGLNWLRFSWGQGTNTILADEMGLGKTIQTIAFLLSLVKEGHSNGPFLVSAPLSTIINWEREFEFWAPDLYVVTYTGDKENRAVIRENEFSFMDGAIRGGTSKLYRMKKEAPIKFHVLLTSYEYISVDATVLQSLDWAVLVVDEAHRLKNNQSKFFRVLSQYNIKYKLLLTGTPLQNNLEELFHLLNFLTPKSFNSLEEFQEEFQDISKEEQVSKLHELLACHLLRRLKADVLKNIPSKSELIVRVDLAPLQKKYYRWVLTKNFEKLNQRGSQPVSLLNIMMDLKKVCNHPYLFPSAAEEAPLTSSGYYEGSSLVAACGKLMVLEKMLRKLREGGHRVLIFSQMTKMLDILEDFLEYLGFQYERIDGSITGGERQQCIDRFNAPNAPQFVFLLSTRAGGLGINLATADTVIIYDSDWNPHNDIQAFSRAHRIGQENKVMIYRFVMRGSVEERICEVAKRKMMLTHLVVRAGIGSSNQPSLSKRELNDILKFGTEELFKDEGDEEKGIVYDDRAIDVLLDRSQVGEDRTDENLLANEYLSQFKVASYVMKEKEEPEPETEILKEAEPEPSTDVDFWERLLRHHYEQRKELEAAKLGKGKRVRKQVNYLDSMGNIDSHDMNEEEGSNYEESDEPASDDGSDDEVEFPDPGSRKKGRLATRNKHEVPPLLAKVNGTVHVYGFNPRQRKAFLSAVLRLGMPPPDAYQSHWMPKELKNKSEPAFAAYVNMFMRHLCEPDVPSTDCYGDGVPKDNVPRQNVLTRIGMIRLVRNKVEQYREINGEYSMMEDMDGPAAAHDDSSASAAGNQPDPSNSVVPCPTSSSDSVPPDPVSVAAAPPNSDPARPETVATGDDKSTGTAATEGAAEKAPATEGSTGETPPPDKPATATRAVPDLEKSGAGNDQGEVVAMETDPDQKDAPTTDEKASSDQDASSEPVILSVTKGSRAVPRFMFNIADGGFTELHALWSSEKTKGFNPKIWGRRHDYWLLRGVVDWGYCRWLEICLDPRFSLLNQPFQPDDSLLETKNRFIMKRFKLLEQALAVEEELHRASSAGLVQDPNQAVMQLHSRFTDLDCLADGHMSLVKDCLHGDKNSIMLMRKALGRMEELLLEMKQDVSRLSVELTKLPSVSSQLKIDELSILGKLAVKGVKPSALATVGGSTGTTTTTSTSQKSVITQAKGTTVAHAVTTATSTASQPLQTVTQAPSVAVATVASVKTSTAVSTAAPVTTSVKAADRMIVLPSSSKVQLVPAKQHAQAQPQVAQTGTAKVQSGGTTTYAIGVPQYVDGSTVYQALPVVPGQQVVYWSPSQMAVVQQQQLRSQASVVMTTAQKAVKFAVAQPKQSTPATSATVASGKTQKVSVITIE